MIFCPIQAVLAAERHTHCVICFRTVFFPQPVYPVRHSHLWRVSKLMKAWEQRWFALEKDTFTYSKTPQASMAAGRARLRLHPCKGPQAEAQEHASRASGLGEQTEPLVLIFLTSSTCPCCTLELQGMAFAKPVFAGLAKEAWPEDKPMTKVCLFYLLQARSSTVRVQHTQACGITMSSSKYTTAQHAMTRSMRWQERDAAGKACTMSSPHTVPTCGRWPQPPQPTTYLQPKPPLQDGGVMMWGFTVKSDEGGSATLYTEDKALRDAWVRSLNMSAKARKHPQYINDRWAPQLIAGSAGQARASPSAWCRQCMGTATAWPYEVSSR